MRIKDGGLMLLKVDGATAAGLFANHAGSRHGALDALGTRS